jgi:hypothetical protein
MKRRRFAGHYSQLSCGPILFTASVFLNLFRPQITFLHNGGLMAAKWSAPRTFHMGINMAGAVSAGAYTAGVLDFLTEALEQWYAEKARPGAAVPRHEVSIDVFSGASAGGMCAAISAVMVQTAFEHIHDPAAQPAQPTTNKFYESWVNKIDIEPLLGEVDLQNGAPVISLLDSTIIDQIADYAISPGPVVTRPYISDSLTLFLSLTNVRGVPFSLTADAEGSAEEEIAYYADYLQFETVSGASATTSPLAKPLPIGSNTGAWPLLKDAAKATGAFPLFLAPRVINRSAGDYFDSPWQPFSDDLEPAVPAVAQPVVDPHWALKPDDSFTTLNVDGGLTDNDPFQLAHDFLAIHNPAAQIDPVTGELANPRSAEESNCAVLTVAPFPATAPFEPNFDFNANSAIFGMLPNLLNVLISQSRFQGESLSAAMGSASYSRFVLAPSDADIPQQDALQCGLLSAFGGFFERGFRAHDYQLGRRNCQKFLRDHFHLATSNPIISAGLDDASRAAVIAAFDRKGKGFLPIIPLCGSAAAEVPAPPRATITQSRLNHILNWIVDRLHAVARPMIESSVGTGFEGFTVRQAADILITTVAKPKIRKLLQDQLGDLISG